MTYLDGLQGSLELGLVKEEYENQFATIHNLEHCVKYLNQTLVAYGFPAPLELGSSNPESIVRTCNCIYAVLQQRQQDIGFRETSNEQRQRLCSDMSRLEAKVERLEGQVAAKEREMATMASKEQKLSSNFKAQLEKIQQERDELQKMVIGSQQVRTQQFHELKRKEKEYIKLQERLNQVLCDKKKESKSGMEIMSLLQKEGRQRGTWNSKKADGDFYKMIVDAYESKKQELVTENADLRALLRSMQSDMRNLLNNGMIQNEDTVKAEENEPPATPLGGRTDVFDLPFHLARDQIEESLRAKMASIKEYMMQMQQSEKESRDIVGEVSDRELDLEAQLVEARSIIQEQADLMNKHIPKPQDEKEGELAKKRYGEKWSAFQTMSAQLDKGRQHTKERLENEIGSTYCWDAFQMNAAAAPTYSTLSPLTVFKELRNNAEDVGGRNCRVASTTNKQLYAM